MNEDTYALLGLSFVLAVLSILLLLAALRLRAVGRLARASVADEGARASTFMATAVQEAVGKLREQERAMQARAGEPRPPRRADRRDRTRVPQWPVNDSWLRAPPGSDRRARPASPLRRRDSR